MSDVDYSKVYDLIVVGLGPASYTAGIYALRYKLDVLLVGDIPGGYVSQTHLIENYPGFDKVTGQELSNKMHNHYLSLGGNFLSNTIVNIKKQESNFILTTDSNNSLKAKTVIVATGTKRKKLNIDGEDKFFGRGVSYCATCDAPFFKDKIVAVVGGGNSAFGAALHLSKYAQKVYLIHRRSEFRADPVEINSVKSQNNVEFILDTVINKINGVMKINSVDLENIKTNEKTNLQLDGVFIEAGSAPMLSLFSDLKVDLDDFGYIKVNPDMSTNVLGLYGAGDCTNAMNNLKQIVTAVASGAIATESAYKLVNK